LGGAWRWIYVTAAVTALWFNVFVLIVQALLKLTSLPPRLALVGITRAKKEAAVAGGSVSMNRKLVVI
jgi:hypothetical protein